MNFRNYFVQHSRFGKIIGVVLGFLMAGPLGAFIGLFVGNFFDKGLSQHFNKPHWSYRSEQEDTTKLYFLKATFAAMGYIGKADGRVTESFILNTQEVMQELGLNSAQKELAQQFFRAGKDSKSNIIDYIYDFKGIAKQHLSLLKLSAELIYRVSKTDGLSNAKIIRINEIFILLGLAPLNIQQRFYQDFSHEHQYQEQRQSRKTYTGGIDEAYALLQVSSHATEQEVKRKYRRLMSQNHPDKLIAKGASEQAIKIANEKTQAISRAYEQIREYKGW